MNRQSIKENLYKYAPIAVFALNALTVLLFLFCFASIFYEKINVITIFQHFGNISYHNRHSNGEFLSLFIASAFFVVIFIILVALLIKSINTLRYALLTRVLDFKLEYVIKIRNNYVYTLLFSAIYVAIVCFLSAAKVSFLAVLVFVIGLLVLTALKFFLALTEEDYPLEDIIKETAKQLLLNVVFFASCAFLLIPAFEMIIQGYRHVAFLLPSEKAFSAFYTDSLICNVFVGVVAVLVYAANLSMFFLSNRNTLREGPVYRSKTKSSFVVFIVTTVLLTLVTLFNVLVGISSLKLTFSQLLNLIRTTLIPCLLLSVVGLITYALDFKKIKDEE